MCGRVLCVQERRKRQQWEVVYKHSETAQKVAARAFAQRYLADLLPSVFDSLRDGGYFYDPVERGLWGCCQVALLLSASSECFQVIPCPFPFGIGICL